MKRLPIGCKNIDTALEGGFDPGIITEIYGEGGSGKTTLCLQAARSSIMEKFGKVAFVDSEGISVDRMKQIFGDNFDEVSREILFFEPFSLDEQEEAVEKIIKMIMAGDTKISLIIIDSVTVFYRLTLGSDQDLAGRRSLSEQVIKLMALARKKNIYIITTSQVYTDITNNEYLPLGGHILSHNAKAILRLNRHKGNLRSMTIMKHRSIFNSSDQFFRLTNNGMEPDLNTDGKKKNNNW